MQRLPLNPKEKTMDALSSSSTISSALPLKKFLLSPNSSLASSSIFYTPRFNISCVRIEERPEITTSRIPRESVERASSRAEPVSPPPTPLSSPPPPKRQAESSLPLVIFKAFDDIVNNFIDPPLRQSVDPKYVLSNNFAPVTTELPPTECEVIEGSLPACLDGAYIRNGPNPQFLPRGPYHLFDGDGMLHCICISQGKATLCSRYVQTQKYLSEKKVGRPLLPNVFSGFHGLTASAARGALSAAQMLAGLYNPADGIGLANTSLAVIGNRLYALGESDLPYEIRVTSDGDIQTLGRQDFDGKLFMSMTAHPKTDPDTGEAFAFRYGPMPPFLTFFRFDAEGRKHGDVPIFSMTRPSFLHDFAITNRYFWISFYLRKHKLSETYILFFLMTPKQVMYNEMSSLEHIYEIITI